MNAGFWQGLHYFLDCQNTCYLRGNLLEQIPKTDEAKQILLEAILFACIQHRVVMIIVMSRSVLAQRVQKKCTRLCIRDQCVEVFYRFISQPTWSCTP